MMKALDLPVIARCVGSRSFFLSFRNFEVLGELFDYQPIVNNMNRGGHPANKARNKSS